MHELKSYRGVMSSDTEEWWKIWRRNDLSIKNWIKKFDEFSLELSKVPKICTLMSSFWPKNIMFKLISYIGPILHDARQWCKILKKKLACVLENDMRNLENFHQSTWKSRNWNFNGILLSKVENIWAENLQGSYV